MVDPGQFRQHGPLEFLGVGVVRWCGRALTSPKEMPRASSAIRGLGAHKHRPERLPPRSALLLYTDGLIERRGESLDEGMARLRRHTAATARAPLDVFRDELIIKFGADAADDTALLAPRPGPLP